jgi:CubicO group peptidase (beta-lactamase class C family)
MTPITPDTVFQTASISKPVTAWGVMRLVEGGLVDLDAGVERYLTRWAFPSTEFDVGEVTVRRLLSHTAGISVPSYRGLPTAESASNLEAALSGEAGCAAVRLTRPPGTGLMYSGGGYGLLQLMVEEVSGRPFARFMWETILEPLGMVRSSFGETRLSADSAGPHDWEGNPIALLHYPVAAAAGLLSTAADLARFVAAGFAGPDGAPAGRGVLRPETVGVLLAPQPEAEDEWTLGYATRLLANRVRIHFHTGANTGFTAAIAAAPELGEGLVVLTNSDRGSEIMWDLFEVWEAKTAGLSLGDLIGGG